MHCESLYMAPGLHTCLQVEQFDTHSAATTVREALIFSGVLRNEKDVDMKTTLEFVDQVSTEMFHRCSPAFRQAGHCLAGQGIVLGLRLLEQYPGALARFSSMQRCIVCVWPSSLCCCWVVVVLTTGYSV